MSVVVHYLAVIFIWSTTPLAIKLSNDSASPHAAVMLRMLLAFFLASAVIALWQNQAVLKLRHIKVYAAASISIFPNMPLVYWASQYIPSGLVAVLFALTPITSGLMAALVLKEKVFNRSRVLALGLAISGLALIYADQWQRSATVLTGLVLMLASNAVFSCSQLMVKQLQAEHRVCAFEQTFGALTFSLPGLMLCWYLFDGNVPAISLSSGYAIVYLAIVGSLLGFAAYFSVLNALPVTVVSLIPLITPAFALWLGALLLHEPISLTVLLGTALIIAGLALYDGVFAAFQSAAKTAKAS